MTEPEKDIGTSTVEPVEETPLLSPEDERAAGFDEDPTEGGDTPPGDADKDAEAPQDGKKESEGDTLSPDAGDEDKPSDKDADPAKTRAEELLAEQARLKEESDRVAQELQVEDDRVAQEEILAEKVPITAETIADFSTRITPEDLPETIMVDDEPLELREFAQSSPEVMAIAGAVAQRNIEHMVKTGKLVAPEQMRTNLEELDKYYFGQLYEMRVEQGAYQKFGKDLRETMNSSEWKAWEANASKADKALLASTPQDFLLGFGNFMKAQGVESQKADNKVADEKARVDKKAHDDLYAGGIKSKGGGSSGLLTSGDADADRAAGFNSVD